MFTTLKYNNGPGLIFKLVTSVFPKVKTKLKSYNNICLDSGDTELGRQAAASINHKMFHCLGGSVYALYPNTDLKNAIRFIVSFQTISDYLDNLCDRSEIKNEAAFRQLHTSMFDAVKLSGSLNDYYRYYPYKNDNNYLNYLVNECRICIKTVPSYNKIKKYLMKYIKLYSELQTLKHLSMDIREERLMSWATQYIKDYRGISVWEFCAATGSTLGIFVMFVSAFKPELTKSEVDILDNAYFPWINSLHILMDYFIDYIEDKKMGDLNFTYYYKDFNECEKRLIFFINQSLDMCSKLPFPLFHKTVVKGITAMYLSDSKTFSKHIVHSGKRIIKKCSNDTKIYLSICKLLRSAGLL